MVNRIFRSIKSRTKEAITQILGLIFGRLECRLVNKYYANELVYPPIFIVGAPRTGSTILYQLISNCFDVLYFNNLMMWFVHIPVVGMMLNQKLYRDKSHNSFQSCFGQTFGLNSPAECGTFFYRWIPLPSETDFLDPLDISDECCKELRNVISALVHRYRRPILFKHMGIGQKLKVIARLFPEAIIIICRRNPVFTAQSIIEVRERISGNRTTWWSIRPKQTNALLDEHYVDQVVKQVYYIEQQINNDLKLFHPERCLTVTYDDLCRDPRNITSILEGIFARISVQLKRKWKARIPNIKSSNVIRVKPEIYNKIKDAVDKLDWINYVD